MNNLFNKILFLAFIDIFLTAVDFVDAYQVGYFEEWYDEIDDEIICENKDFTGFEGKGLMIQCPFCKNDNNKTIYQYDKDLIGIADYGRMFTCLECNQVFYKSCEEVNGNEIFNFKKC